MAGFTILVEKRPFSGFISILEKLPDWMILAVLAATTSALFVAGRISHFILFQESTEDGPLNYILQATLTYPPFFLLGIVFYKSNTIFKAVHRVSILQTLVSFGLLAVIWSSDEWLTSTIGFAASEAVRHFSQELAGFYICCLFLLLFSKYVKKHNRLVRYLSDSSYTVYLFHIFVLVSVDWMLLSFVGDSFIVYALSIPIAYLICIALHRYVVTSSPVLAYLFNGKPLQGRRT